jgi:hypothetical protein
VVADEPAVHVPVRVAQFSGCGRDLQSPALPPVLLPSVSASLTPSPAIASPPLLRALCSRYASAFSRLFSPLLSACNTLRLRAGLPTVVVSKSWPVRACTCFPCQGLSSSPARARAVTSTTRTHTRAHTRTRMRTHSYKHTQTPYSLNMSDTTMCNIFSHFEYKY